MTSKKKSSTNSQKPRKISTLDGTAPANVGRHIRRLKNLIFFFFKTFYRHSGISYVCHKMIWVGKENHPTLFLWLIGFYGTLFTYSDQLYKRSLENLDSQLTFAISSAQNDSELLSSSISKIYSTRIPIKPNLFHPDTVFKAVWGQGYRSHEMESKIRTLIAEKRISLSNLNLPGIDLSNVNLSNSNFTNSNFSYSTFENTNLSNSTFNESTFEGAKFENTKLSKSKINKSTFKESIFKNVNISDSSFKNSDFSRTKFNNTVGKGSDISNTIFKNSEMENTGFSRSFIKNCSYEKARLIHTVFIGSSFESSDLNGSRIYNSNFTEANFYRSFLNNTEFKDTGAQNSIFKESNLHGVLFYNSSLRGALLTKSNITDANFTGSDLRSSIFQDSCSERNLDFDETNNRINILCSIHETENIISTASMLTNITLQNEIYQYLYQEFKSKFTLSPPSPPTNLRISLCDRSTLFHPIYNFSFKGGKPCSKNPIFNFDDFSYFFSWGD